MSRAIEPVDSTVVEMQGIRRRFGSVVALDGADLSLRAGEVHAVLGENGAGKTTLLSVLSGLIRPDGGLIRIDGAPVHLRSPREAWSQGIGMVHQHFALVPRLTVLENLMLGARSRGAGWLLPSEDLGARTAGLMRSTGLQVDLQAVVETLGVGSRQRVEILKVLLRDPRVLVLDEPTAVLAPAEVDGLLELLRRSAQGGTAVVLVAHKLDEVLAVADRVTVLRRGRTVLVESREAVDGPTLSEAMVGRSVVASARPGDPPEDSGEVVARLRAVGTERSEAGGGLRGVDLEVRRGEIVAVAGVEGNGQRDLALVLTGLLSPTEGEVELPPAPGLIPQDRREEGLIPDLDLAENLALALHGDVEYQWGPFLRWSRLREEATDQIRRFSVQAPGWGSAAGSLSGGNQQRWVVAREMGRASSLLVAENPTRGLDVAGEAFVQRELIALREREDRPGIVLISSDLDEVVRLADRVFTMVRGTLREVPQNERTREGIGRRMLVVRAGVRDEGSREGSREGDAGSPPESKLPSREGRGHGPTGLSRGPTEGVDG